MKNFELQQHKSWDKQTGHSSVLVGLPPPQQPLNAAVFPLLDIKEVRSSLLRHALRGHLPFLLASHSAWPAHTDLWWGVVTRSLTSGGQTPLKPHKVFAGAESDRDR